MYLQIHIINLYLRATSLTYIRDESVIIPNIFGHFSFIFMKYFYGTLLIEKQFGPQRKKS